MKSLLSMAKQRRKQQPKQFKPVGKLNLNNKKQPEPEPSQDQQYGQQFQEQYQPDEQEILGYAAYIGINLPEQEDLLYIAKEGLMANLPPDWDQQQTQDGDILYINRRTGEILGEHPCDQYYRQLVLKQRKKRGGSKQANKFTGILPVGSAALGTGAAQSKILPAQQPKKQMDPLVKMQMQKKKKKMQQQKRRQFQDKKKQIASKYEKKKQNLETQLKAIQKKLKKKYEEQLQTQKTKLNKKMSQQQKAQQQKIRREMEKFQRQARLKVQKKYSDRRDVEKEKISKAMKAKRQEIRISLQNVLKGKKKQIQQQYKEKIKVLADKQRQSAGQRSESEIIAQQIANIKQEIVQKKIKQHTEKLNLQRQQQQAYYKTKLREIQNAYQAAVKSLQTSAPKNQVKFDALAQEVQQIEQREMQALQYELTMTKQLKNAQKQYQLQKYKKTFLQQTKQILQRLQRQTQNSISKLKRAKQQQFQNKITEAEKKIKQTYLISLKQIKHKFDQQEEIIQLQSHNMKKDKNVESSSVDLMNQALENLSRKQQSYKAEIAAIKEEIEKLAKNHRPIKHRLNDQQLRMYQLICEKLEERDGH